MSDVQAAAVAAKIETLGDYIQLISGVHIPAQLTNEHGQGAPYLTGPADFVAGRAVPTRFTTHPQVMCDPEDILLTVKGSGAGRVATSNARACISRQLAVLRPTSGDAHFWRTYLDSMFEELRARACSGLIPGLTRSDILSLHVPTVSSIEQRKIAEILDTADESIRSTERLIAKLANARIGLLRFSIAGRQSHEEELLSSVVPRAEYGISAPLDYDGRTPVLRMNNIVAGEARLADVKSTSAPVPPNLMLKPGDVLFNRTNSIDHVGRTGIWRGEAGTHTFASYLVRLVCDPQRLDAEYLNLWMQLPEVQSNIRAYATPGVHQVNINPTNLRKTWIALPTIGEQRSIVELMNAHSNEFARHKAERSKLRGVKRGLMEDLLTGRVRVKVD